LTLEGALRRLAADRTAPAAEVVRAGSRLLLKALSGCDRDDGGGADLPTDFTWREWLELDPLAPLAAAHGWRGPVARWLTTLEALPGWAREHLAPGVTPGEVLAEELGLWLDGFDMVASGSEPSPGDDQGQTWSAEPLAPGRRLADREVAARQTGRHLAPGERVLVHGYSHTLAGALVAAWEAGREVEVVLSESPANLGGRRQALKLVQAGLPVRLTWDLALHDELPAADWLLVGTEAVGAAAFLAPRGSRSLLEAARRLGIPSAVVTTTDKLMPGGELRSPAAGEESDLLWELPPEGVTLDCGAWEEVPLDLPTTFITEHGASTAVDLFVRTPVPTSGTARTDTTMSDTTLTR
jgi:hypothetical protein